MPKSSLVKVKVPKKKRIALVAHDGLKPELFAWMAKHIETLRKHELCGTGTTSSIIRDNFNVDITSYYSGPLGGDQQIGAAIAQGDIDVVIFFWDPLEAQPHDPDVKALLRISVLYDIPVAMSPMAATILIESDMMDKEYIKYVPNSKQNVDNRIKDLNIK